MHLARPTGFASEWLLALVSIFGRYRIGIGSYVRIEAHGRDRLAPFPFLLCSNHASHIDYIALIEALGISHDQIIAIAAEDFHFDLSARSRLLRRLFNLAAIERGASPESIRNCVRTCRDFVDRGGKVVLIYPEGTRTRDGSIGPFKNGFALIASMLNLPLVPAYVDGSYRLFSRHHIFPRPGVIDVRFGETIVLDRSGGAAARRFGIQEAKALAGRVERSIRALAGEAPADRA
jgi:1-acyl-sn-glycerol-3-phosphate acyltransferase